MAGLTLKDFLNELREQGGSQTLSHVINVANLMEQMAKALHYNEEVQNKWYYAGLLHDAGKLFVPAKILSKKTDLTDKEYVIVMSHVNYGEAVIKQLKIHDNLKQCAINCSNYHHAWRNGQKKDVNAKISGGYYKGMNEKNISYSAIPEEAQVCEVCDIFEALTADRSYCNSMSKEEALSLMDKMLRQGQLSPKYYRIFVCDVLGKEFLVSEKKVA